MTRPPERVAPTPGRGGPAVPLPPRVYEPTTRLVYSDLGLPDLFAHAASAGGLAAVLVHVEDLPAAVAAHCGPAVYVAASPLLRKVRLAEALASAGHPSAAQADPGCTLVAGCDAAVAETGSLVFRGGLPPGWRAAATRLVVLEPKNLLPDLFDLLVGHPGELTLISGPSDVRVFVLH